MSGVELVVLLLQVAPSLGAEVLSILTKGGHVSAQEWSDYITTKWPDANSFFGPAPVAAPKVGG